MVDYWSIAVLNWLVELDGLWLHLCSDVQAEGDAQKIAACNCRGLCGVYAWPLR